MEYNRLPSNEIKTFELLYKNYYVYLCCIAEQIVKNREDAEEVVADVFIKLWNKRDSADSIISIKAYLIRAVRNTALNYKEKKIFVEKQATLNLELSDFEWLVWDADYPLGRLFQDEILQILKREIKLLPKGCREIFLLSRNKSLSYFDIAQKLGISVNTVKSQMKIALSRLREILKDYLTILLIFIGL